uniref:Mitochondrial transcription termination factor 3 n=1 Tax=Eptatretus burgeri TaxID=7764 RepID=A0A8C4RC16_EPTBU
MVTMAFPCARLVVRGVRCLFGSSKATGGASPLAFGVGHPAKGRRGRFVTTTPPDVEVGVASVGNPSRVRGGEVAEVHKDEVDDEVDEQDYEAEEELGLVKTPPPLPSTATSFRSYVGHSETLQKLVRLGMDLWRVERKIPAANILLRLSFEKDVQPRLVLLQSFGLQLDRLGRVLTRNPYLLNPNLLEENLKARVDFLLSRHFTREMVGRMIGAAPFLLSLSVQRLDNRLAFYQNELGLSPRQTRELTSRLPSLITASLAEVEEIMKTMMANLGFRRAELRALVTKVPRILLGNRGRLIRTFDLLHNIIGIPHHLLVEHPQGEQVFRTKLQRIRVRHAFLKSRGLANFDPAHPPSVSLERFAALPDEAFCQEIVGATVQEFLAFQKTI